jgi:hypothetical protein
MLTGGMAAPIAPAAPGASSLGAVGSASLGVSIGMAVGELVGSVCNYFLQKSQLDFQVHTAENQAAYQDASGKLQKETSIKALDYEQKKIDVQAAGQKELNKALEGQQKALNDLNIVKEKNAQSALTEKTGDLGSTADAAFAASAAAAKRTPYYSGGPRIAA